MLCFFADGWVYKLDIDADNDPEVPSPLALQGMMSSVRALLGGPKSEAWDWGWLPPLAMLHPGWKTGKPAWKGLETEVWDGWLFAFVHAVEGLVWEAL